MLPLRGLSVPREESRPILGQQCNRRDLTIWWYLRQKQIQSTPRSFIMNLLAIHRASILNILIFKYVSNRLLQLILAMPATSANMLLFWNSARHCCMYNCKSWEKLVWHYREKVKKVEKTARLSYKQFLLAIRVRSIIVTNRQGLPWRKQQWRRHPSWGTQVVNSMKGK